MSTVWLLPLVIMMVGCPGNRHPETGVNGDRFAACPDSPNCVSSKSSDPRHAIAPVGYKGTIQQARRHLAQAISGMKRVRIVAAEERYIHAEFTSAVFRFVDDVEFLLDEGTSTIDVRSASRVGYSDFGVNRRRVEEFRARFDVLNKERTQADE